jgi:hypothetical protein
MYTINEIIQKINFSLDKLYNEHQELFDDDVNEVTINSYFAGYLRFQFPEHRIDTEYNRQHNLYTGITETKKTITPEGNINQIKPDIIIWKNTLENPNLVVIECKKEWNKDKIGRDKDLIVLGGMTMNHEQAEKVGHQDPIFSYKYGIYVNYGRNRNQTKIYRIENGTKILKRIKFK